jgi:hypothetical protein
MRIHYWWEIQRKRDQYENQDVDGCIILGWIWEWWVGWGDVDWIGLAKDRNR